MNTAWKFSSVQIPPSAVPEKARGLFEPFAALMPISELEELAASSDVVIRTGLPAGLNQFVTLYDNLDCVSIWAELPRQKFRAVLDAIRAKVVEYAIAIEKANPSAGEATPGEKPIPSDELHRIQQIFLGGSHVVTTAAGDLTQ